MCTQPLTGLPATRTLIFLPWVCTYDKAILQALKTYGMFVADNGSNWYISGAPDPRWNNDKLVGELGSVKGSNFEVVRMDGLVTP